jgi:hypothetical protein
MSTKTVNAKKFVKETGTTNQLFVFAGYNPNPILSDANETAINLWNYSDFAVRVGQNSVLPVVPYIKWTEKRPFKPWYSTKPNIGNYYAYNDQNGYVYLCISDNTNNRSDHSGLNVSNIRPSHISGIQRYSDGYSWKPLYKITSSIERFVSTSWLPVVSFDLFDNTPQTSQTSLTQNFCGSFGTGETGQCAIYAKIALNTDDDAGTTEYEKGDLFTIASNITCSDCYYLMNGNDKYEPVFYNSTTTVPTTRQILDNYSTIGSLINTNEITASSPYYHLYQINENDGISEGSVISAFIDLSGFSTTQLIVTSSNPEFTVSSNTGTGARIRLKTSIYNGSYIITGIEVLESGSYYKDITLSINSSYLSVDSSVLISAIDVNIDTIDGLGFDPVEILNAEHVMVDARVEKKTIQDSTIILPNKLNFFGLIQNPESVVSTNQVTSGSNQNKKIDVVYRTTIKAEISNSSSSDLPTSDESYNIPDVDTESDPNVTSSTTNRVLIGGVGSLGEGGVAGFFTSVEMKNVSYSKADYLVGTTFVGQDKSNNEITVIQETPEFVQYTGKVLTSKKLTTDLPISDVDSVIIRINMVKGM